MAASAGYLATMERHNGTSFAVVSDVVSVSISYSAGAADVTTQRHVAASGVLHARYIPTKRDMTLTVTGKAHANALAWMKRGITSNSTDSRLRFTFPDHETIDDNFFASELSRSAEIDGVVEFSATFVPSALSTPNATPTVTDL